MGIGGSSAAVELGQLTSVRDTVVPVGAAEREQRLAKAQRLMRDQGIDALYLDASTSLRYFTGLQLWRSERLHGAVLPANGDLTYISPKFEEAKLRASLTVGGRILCWEEHEDPCALVIDAALGHAARGPGAVRLATDEVAPVFVFDGLRRVSSGSEFLNGQCITAPCRMIKSAAEIALMQTSMSITLTVHEATARILRPGITHGRSRGVHRRGPHSTRGRRAAEFRHRVVRRADGLPAWCALPADA